MAEFLHGTCGFSYGHWAGGVFYPRGLPPSERLVYYAERFPVVEIDATFYRLPAKDVVARWRDVTPDRFRFVFKGSRLITHALKLTDCREALEAFFDRAAPLGGKLDAVLWQTPPTLPADPLVLDGFCELLQDVGPPVRHAFEFRHESWHDPAVLEVLKTRGHALVVADPPRGVDALRAAPTAAYAYVRFHSGDPGSGGGYGPDGVAPWARRIRGWLDEGRDVYALFNNDWGGHAPKDAALLAELVEPRRAAG